MPESSQNIIIGSGIVMLTSTNALRPFKQRKTVRWVAGGREHVLLVIWVFSKAVKVVEHLIWVLQ